jgi:hypothetical protein
MCLQWIYAPGLLLSYFCHYLVVLSLSFLHFSLSYNSTESPLLWIRADPDMEYLAEVHFNQPVQMWVRMRLWFTSMVQRQLIFRSYCYMCFYLPCLQNVLISKQNPKIFLSWSSPFLVYEYLIWCWSSSYEDQNFSLRPLCLTCHLINTTELKSCVKNYCLRSGIMFWVQPGVCVCVRIK